MTSTPPKAEPLVLVERECIGRDGEKVSTAQFLCGIVADFWTEWERQEREPNEPASLSPAGRDAYLHQRLFHHGVNAMTLLRDATVAAPPKAEPDFAAATDVARLRYPGSVDGERRVAFVDGVKWAAAGQAAPQRRSSPRRDSMDDPIIAAIKAVQDGRAVVPDWAIPEMRRAIAAWCDAEAAAIESNYEASAIEIATTLWLKERAASLRASEEEEE